MWLIRRQESFLIILLAPFLLASEKPPAEARLTQTLTLIAQKKQEVQRLIIQEEPTNDETVLRCLKTKFKALEELERAVLRVAIQYSLERFRAEKQKIAWEGSNPPSPREEAGFAALLNKAEGEAIRIADEAYLCLTRESGGPVFPYGMRTEPPPQKLPDLPLPPPALLEPNPKDRPFSPYLP